MIRGFSSFFFLSDSKTESESENMINFSCLRFEMMLRARFIAVKMKLSIGRDFLMIVLFRTAAHVVLLLSLEPSVKTYMVGMKLKDIAKFLFINPGVVFGFGEFIQFENYFWFLLIIQGGVYGKVLSCLLFCGIIDSCRVDFIRRPKGFITFIFLSKCCLYLGLKVQS